MRMKNDAKIEDGLTSQFKIGMSNLTNFDSSTQKTQKFALSWLPFIKVHVWSQKVQESYVW